MMPASTRDVSLAPRLARYLPALACPECHGPLRLSDAGLTCIPCSAAYPTEEGTPALLTSAGRAFRQAMIRQPVPGSSGAKRLGRLREMLPVPERLIQPRTRAVEERTLGRVEAGNPQPLVANVGSASKAPRGYILNVDLVPGTGVDLVADALDLPFQEGSLDAVLLDNVLEHVLDPARVASEVGRVLRPGGLVYAVTPFLYEYHPVPTDYWRFTPSGLSALFWRFEAVESGSALGPAETIIPLLVNSLATHASFGSTRIYRVLRRLLALALFPLGRVDRITPRALRPGCFTASVYFVGRKPTSASPAPDDPRLALLAGRPEAAPGGEP